jgi:hypothetical protein
VAAIKILKCKINYLEISIIDFGKLDFLKIILVNHSQLEQTIVLRIVVLSQQSATRKMADKKFVQ